MSFILHILTFPLAEPRSLTLCINGTNPLKLTLFKSLDRLRIFDDVFC